MKFGKGGEVLQIKGGLAIERQIAVGRAIAQLERGGQGDHGSVVATETFGDGGVQVKAARARKRAQLRAQVEIGGDAAAQKEVADGIAASKVRRIMDFCERIETMPDDTGLGGGGEIADLGASEGTALVGLEFGDQIASEGFEAGET